MMFISTDMDVTISDMDVKDNHEESYYCIFFYLNIGTQMLSLRT